MDSLLIIALLFLALEAVFFLICFRWLNSGKKLREKDFALLDVERVELIKAQGALKRDVDEARALADDTLKKLRILGADAHSEWTDMKNNLQILMREFAESSRTTLDGSIETIAKHKLSLDKAIREAGAREKGLVERLRDVERVLKFLDNSVPVEEILKDLQEDKYKEAKRLLSKGVDAAVIGKKLGISLNELSLISHIG